MYFNNGHILSISLSHQFDKVNHSKYNYIVIVNRLFKALNIELLQIGDIYYYIWHTTKCIQLYRCDTTLNIETQFYIYLMINNTIFRIRLFSFNSFQIYFLSTL